TERTIESIAFDPKTASFRLDREDSSIATGHRFTPIDSLNSVFVKDEFGGALIGAFKGFGAGFLVGGVVGVLTWSPELSVASLLTCTVGGMIIGAIDGKTIDDQFVEQ
ncbi:MAG: hypothetical protein H7X80_10060, partial [bacterium]|nr:hypothetical protein [Candidatus Kapabacteria bacterium]